MLRERVRRHYEERGYLVEEHSVADVAVRADLFVEKMGRRRAVRVDDDPMGAYQIGALAAEAKRARIQATVVCPATPDVIAACEQFGVEHLSPEGVGEETPILAPGRRPVLVAAPARKPIHEDEPLAAVVAVQRPASQDQGIPSWRWGVVAAIWILAVVAWAYLLVRIF